MNRTVRMTLGTLILVGGLSLMTGCQPSGVLVSAGEGKVTIRSTQDDVVTTYEVAPDAKITRDNEPAKLDELVSGDTVAVTLAQKGETMVAMSVSAWSKQEPRPSKENPSTPAIPSEDQILQDLPPVTDDKVHQPLPSDELPIPPRNGADEANPEEGAPPLPEGGGVSTDEPRLEGEAAPPDNNQTQDP